jgi:hypothetical protein
MSGPGSRRVDASRAQPGDAGIAASGSASSATITPARAKSICCSSGAPRTRRAAR